MRVCSHLCFLLLMWYLSTHVCFQAYELQITAESKTPARDFGPSHTLTSSSRFFFFFFEGPRAQLDSQWLLQWHHDSVSHHAPHRDPIMRSQSIPGKRTTVQPSPPNSTKLTPLAPAPQCAKLDWFTARVWERANWIAFLDLNSTGGTGRVGWLIASLAGSSDLRSNLRSWRCALKGSQGSSSICSSDRGMVGQGWQWRTAEKVAYRMKNERHFLNFLQFHLIFCSSGVFTPHPTFISHLLVLSSHLSPVCFVGGDSNPMKSYHFPPVCYRKLVLYK